jgi:protein phosphatase
MSPPVGLSWAACSEVGRRRDQNEDAWAGEVGGDTAAPRGLFIVCDGMGGHARGEEASALAVRVLRQELAWILDEPWPDDSTLLKRLRDAVLAANATLFEWNEEAARAARERAGTTLVVVALSGVRACLAHVGDSRIYRLTAGGLDRLTTDHNVANREIERGERTEAAWQRADARHLTQALGPRPTEFLRPDVRVLTVEQDALFLLCTDGLSDQDFLERDGVSILAPLIVATADLSAGCRALVDAANDANGHDNLTGLLVRVTGPAAAARPRVPTTERVVLPADPVLDPERSSAA